jgi:cytochrome c biogenesis protein CcdA/thiol-disulfide isomerase/thioredoxin
MPAFIDILLAFIEGIAVVASPCILPILPLILVGSLAEGRLRPYGIIAGFIAIFTVATLLIRQVTITLGIDPEAMRHTAFFLLAGIGLLLIFDPQDKVFKALTRRIGEMGNRMLDKPIFNRTGFFSAFLYGTLIALVWTPCAGPILAASLVQVQTQQTTIAAVVTVLAFVLGASLPMLAIIVYGRQILYNNSFMLKYSYLIRRILGVLILLTVFFGYIRFTPGTPEDLKQVANSEQVTASNLKDEKVLIHGLAKPYKAPDFGGISTWINSKALSLNNLKGKVVLIDFWTYSCINCIRTLPYLKAWYERYKDQGLVIVGVHTPEFFFEHKADNVEQAVNDYKITYPVAMDNDFITWKSYDNHYWPAHYLIDKDGQVVYTHFGEGNYEITEHNIRVLLAAQGEKAKTRGSVGKAESGQSPETYLGFNRASRQVKSSSMDNLPLHTWMLKGDWQTNAENIVSKSSNAQLRFRFYSAKVFLVMGTEKGELIKITLKLNGKPITPKESGKDVKNGILTVKEHRLYELVNLSKQIEGVLEIDVSTEGLECYAFTFGS